MTMTYNNPPSVESDVGATQMNNFYYEKKALIEAAKTQFFGQLADVTSMPKNMGKKIKRYHYLPMLDAANINDQGIDAAGAVITTTEYYVTLPDASTKVTNAVKATAAATINVSIGGGTVATVSQSDGSAGTGFVTVTIVGPLTFKVANNAAADAILALNLGATKAQGSGNLYGSSKDIGTINGRMPVLSEAGGRVNRVGFKRKELEGSLEKFGLFDEYSQESMDFDSDADLQMHITREMIMAANEMTEDALQVDLITSAGVVRYGGAATSRIQLGLTAETFDQVTYATLMRLSIDLDNNRTPKSTKVITGSRMVDTKTIQGGRIAYIGSELLPTLKAMQDLHGNAAWIPVQQYADAGNTVTGEEGAIDALRFVVVPEMVKYAGGGALNTSQSTFYKTNNRFDAFPILVVGDESFTQIGFQTDGKSVKFTIFHKKPGEGIADLSNPYGEIGFMSIKWYYGYMVLRPERIGLVLTTAAL